MRLAWVADAKRFDIWKRAHKYRSIKKNLEFSEHALNEISQKLDAALGIPKPADPAIVVCGSVARFEGSPESDLDYMLVYPGEIPDDANDRRQRVRDAISSFKFKRDNGEQASFPEPNALGVFAGDVQAADLLDIIGQKEEDYKNIARRMLILLESFPIWNGDSYQRLKNQILREYAKDVMKDYTKNFVLLINDLIRYFRSVCVNYHADKETEEGKWPIRNIKLRHSRVLMYSSLLLCLGELSKSEYAEVAGSEPRKWTMLNEFVDMPPLERFVRVYDLNRDPNLYRLLGLYDVFLERMNNPEIRKNLSNLDYDHRYSSPEFAFLKSNSDSFATEIVRFLFARDRQWSDRFFEYIIL